MIYVLLSVLGLLFGSFVTALVDRLHDGRDWVKGRSECDSCHKQLQAIDLVPVFSWLANKGKCRQCQQPVSWRYPSIELVTAASFIASYHFWPVALEGFEVARFVAWLVVVIGLVAMSLYDLRWMLIPNRIVYPLLLLVVLFVVVEAIFFGGGTESVRGAILGLAACGGLFYLLYQLSSGRWIGGGDVKLGFLLGLLAGSLSKGLLVVMLASLAGVVITLPLVAFGKLTPKTRIPFGPLLMSACFFVVLFGQQLVDWYFKDLLLL